MTRLADEWAEDGYGDGGSPYPGADAADMPEADDEPLTDAEGNPVEQVLEPGDGLGVAHAYPPPHGSLTTCCRTEPRDLPSGDTLTRDPDAVTCGDTPTAHLAQYVDDRLAAATACCGLDVRALGRDTLVDYPDGVTCPSYDGREPEQQQPGGDPVLDARQPTADEITRSMAAYARAVRDESREHAGHTDGDARFDPEQGVVICGCGEPIDEGPDGSGYKPMRQPENLPESTAADPVLSDLPNLDPLAHYTPADLERAMLETIRRLDQGLAMQAQWTEVYERALFAYDKAAARARLRVKGGAKDVRDAEVRVACEREADDVAEARMRVEVIKAAMHSLRSVLSGYQSVGRSVGVLVSVGGGDGQPPHREGQRR